MPAWISQRITEMSLARSINQRIRFIPTWPVYLVGALPGIFLFYLAFRNELGADPITHLEQKLGERGLQFLILTLLVTPLRRWTGVNLLKFRRALGLLAFFYVLFHGLVWFVLDRGLIWSEIWTEILKRPFITVGMIGLLAMVPLALTSYNAAIRRLGALAWNRLHRLAYVAVAAGGVHFILIVKAWPLEPIIYLCIITALLGVRAWWAFRRRTVARRAR